MNDIERLFVNNKKWAVNRRKKDHGFFRRLSRIQNPGFLWIGCSDSRVPANEITGLLPGELFVHRNVANIVYADDRNCLAVLRYAIEVLKIRHVIVCGHYNCGGVKAVIEDRMAVGIRDWLKDIRELAKRHSEELSAIKGKNARIDKLCELNVLRQASNVCRSHVLRKAWNSGRGVSVHAWIYDLNDGLLKELRRYRGLNTVKRGRG